MDPLRINFLTAQGRVLVFYDISRDLTEKYFDIVWGNGGATPSGIPQKIYFLNDLTYGLVFYDFSRDLTEKYFGVVWGCHSPGTPLKATQK